MISSWVLAIAVIAAWINGVLIGFLYRVGRERRSADYEFEEQRERVEKSLGDARI